MHYKCISGCPDKVYASKAKWALHQAHDHNTQWRCNENGCGRWFTSYKAYLYHKKSKGHTDVDVLLIVAWIKGADGRMMGIADDKTPTGLGIAKNSAFETPVDHRNCPATSNCRLAGYDGGKWWGKFYRDPMSLADIKELLSRDKVIFDSTAGQGCAGDSDTRDASLADTTVRTPKPYEEHPIISLGDNEKEEKGHRHHPLGVGLPTATSQMATTISQFLFARGDAMKNAGASVRHASGGAIKVTVKEESNPSPTLPSGSKRNGRPVDSLIPLKIKTEPNSTDKQQIDSLEALTSQIDGAKEVMEKAPETMMASGVNGNAAAVRALLPVAGSSKDAVRIAQETHNVPVVILTALKAPAQTAPDYDLMIQEGEVRVKRARMELAEEELNLLKMKKARCALNLK